MTSPNELSFLPDDYLEQKRNRRTNIFCASLFAIVMAALSLAFISNERQMKAIDLRYAAVSRQYTEAAARIEQVQKMQEQQKKMARQAELTASLLEKIPRSFLLAEITNCLPRDVSLLDLVLESKARSAGPTAAAKPAFARRGQAPVAQAPGEPRQYDVAVRITGIADSDVLVAQLMNRLSRSQLVLEVNLVISDRLEKSDGRMRKFQIELKLNPEAFVARQEKARTASIDLGDKP